MSKIQNKQFAHIEQTENVDCATPSEQNKTVIDGAVGNGDNAAQATNESNAASTATATHDLSQVSGVDVSAERDGAANNIVADTKEESSDDFVATSEVTVADKQGAADEAREKSTKEQNPPERYEQPMTAEEVKQLREKEAKKAAAKKRYAIAISVAVVIFVLVGWLQGLFAGPSDGVTSSGVAHWLFTKLCDVFFIDGAIFLAAGGLLFCDKHGAYDTIAYGMRTAVGVMFQSPEKRKYKDLYDYKKSREGKRAEFRYLLWIALVLLVLAVICLVLTYVV